MKQFKITTMRIPFTNTEKEGLVADNDKAEVFEEQTVKVDDDPQTLLTEIGNWNTQQYTIAQHLTEGFIMRKIISSAETTA
jgi:hypothetical protein